jgi:hypothetical protein
MGALISPLPGICFRCFFAHRFYLLRNKAQTPKSVPFPERIARAGLESRFP